MNTSAFLATLRSHADLPLVFRAGSDSVPPGYHLTEVKRVAYDTMDCGAASHRWSETQFEISTPRSASSDRGHMPAGKFLRIVDRVEAQLPLEPAAPARIHASFAGQPASLYAIEALDVREGKLWVELNPDRTHCKAAERSAGASAGRCCGSAAPESEPKVETGCGCASNSDANAAPVACCA